MRQKRTKLISFVLTAVLTMSALLGGGLQMSLPVYAAPGNNANYAYTKGVSLVAGGVASDIGNPVNGNGGWANVWFGHYKQSRVENYNSESPEHNNDPIKWRVLRNFSIAGSGSGTGENSTNARLFLLSDKNLDCKQYNETDRDVTWETCTIRAWLNGGTTSNNNIDYDYTAADSNFKDTAFNDKEQKAVAVSAIRTPVISGDPVNTNDQVFLLSKEEALNTGYGFTSDIWDTTTRGSKNTDYAGDNGAYTESTEAYAGNGWWWLRSPGCSSSDAAYVFSYGNANDYGSVFNINGAVRPALNIDLKSILFTSLIPDTTDEYKLTVKDDKMNLAIGEGGVTRTGNTITVPYAISGENASSADHITLIMTDGEYQKKGAVLKHYETTEIQNPNTYSTGTVTFTLPDDYNENWYTYILAEDINDKYETNYASQPVSTDLVKGIRLVAKGNASGILSGQGSYVWFGKYKQSQAEGYSDTNKVYKNEPIKWRVLDNTSSAGGSNGNGNRRLFLLSDKSLDCKPFNETQTDVTWETCTIRAWLNGRTTTNGGTDYDYTNANSNFRDTAFNGKEQKAVAESSISTEDKINGGTVETNDRVFLLSKEEALNTGYGFTSDTGETTTRGSKNTDYAKYKGAYTSTIEGYVGNGCWWLRSPGYNSNGAAYVEDNGYADDDDIVDFDSDAVRPALNIDLKSILFTSLISGTANEYKLTVKDDKMNLSIGSGGVTRTGNKITVPYTITGDNKADATNVSILITDKEYTESGARLIHYDTKAISGSETNISGSVEFTLPDNFDASRKVYILAEDINGDKETDFASTPVRVENIVLKPVKPVIGVQPAHSGKVTYGDPDNRNLSITASISDSGSLSYQWYGNTKNSTEGGKTIRGEVNSSFNIPTTENAGTHYYYCIVTNTIGDFTASLESAVVGVTIDKASQTAPTAPVKSSATTDSITLKAVTGCEYSRNGQNWQESPVFSGLKEDTEYTFYQRFKGDANHEVSPASQGTKIRTNASPKPQPEPEPKPTKISVKSVSFAKGSVTIPKGKTKKLSVKIKPSDATNKAVTFKSSNKAIATVDKNGKVTAKKTGKVTITVTTKDGKKTAKCTVKVSGMNISKSDMSFNRNKWTCTVKPKLVNDSIKKVISGNTKVATVTFNKTSFKVKFKKKTGKVAITVKTASGITKTLKVSMK